MARSVPRAWKRALSDCSDFIMEESKCWANIGHDLLAHNSLLHTAIVAVFRERGILNARERGARGWDRAGHSLQVDHPQLFAILKEITCTVLDDSGNAESMRAEDSSSGQDVVRSPPYCTRPCSARFCSMGFKRRTAPTKSFGRILRTAREKKGWTPEVLADKVGVTVVYCGRLERGDALPSMSVFVRLIDTLELSADELLATIPDSAPNANNVSPEVQHLLARLRKASPATRRLVNQALIVGERRQ